ncbi:AglZ/HisF2 family acetamidino modification protein [Sphingobacterium paucimobilis]|uniref:imidazole glycerol-phosphate synthase n=1 Tax=Sphingobacterium paucimobilis HER1398 TaxID=1346330 RepID=U2J4Y2_9SPHI|nr:AglZ/HisF2 family acetamidino modification protein [Sphingobacterium paucimobilis]ERJ57723.1 hypothetical protein M472_02985 [Sphingobacterium paucimobilis HER1398]
MIRNRYIPCLLLHDDGLVKSERFKNYKYIGDPINAVKIFNDKEADEIIFLDIDASKYKSGPNFTVLQDLTSECFMPLAYGGGIEKLNQIERLLKLGIEKVIINHMGLESQTFIKEAVSYFGSSTIVGAIDVKRDFFGKKFVYDHVSSRVLKVHPIDLAKRYCETGVGEIFLNSVDLDGTLKGYDLELIANVSREISVPLIASGGASSIDNLEQGIRAGASACAAGSLFVYQGSHKAVLISYPKNI